MIYTTYMSSPVGKIMLAEKDEGLIGLWIEGQKYFFSSMKDVIDEKETPGLIKAIKWLELYFAGKKPSIKELKLTPIGGIFRQVVWKLLCEIPYGETTTYGILAEKTARLMGKDRMSAQAVGGAVGHNPISIIIPCHRVVGADGNLTGYAGGITKKIKLLKHEGVDMNRLYLPKKGTVL